MILRRVNNCSLYKARLWRPVMYLRTGPVELWENCPIFVDDLLDACAELGEVVRSPGRRVFLIFAFRCVRVDTRVSTNRRFVFTADESVGSV